MSGEARIAKRQRAWVLHRGDAGYPQHSGKLIRGDLERTRARSDARRGLRIGRGARGVKGHVALDLLHDLVDVAVENGHRAEAAQLFHELRRITRSPAP